MRTVATLVPEEAEELRVHLQKGGIDTELLTVPQEGGLEMTELQVPDEAYDRACTLADSWASARIRERYARRHCPRCHSGNWESVPHDRLGYVGQCQDCGCEFELR